MLQPNIFKRTKWRKERSCPPLLQRKENWFPLNWKLFTTAGHYSAWTWQASCLSFSYNCYFQCKIAHCATNPKRNGTKKSSYKPNIGLSCFRTLSTSLRLTTIKSSPQLSGKSMMDFPLFRTVFLMAFFTFGKVGSMLKYKQWRIAIVSVSSSTKKRTVTFMWTWFFCSYFILLAWSFDNLE